MCDLSPILSSFYHFSLIVITEILVLLELVISSSTTVNVSIRLHKEQLFLCNVVVVVVAVRASMAQQPSSEKTESHVNFKRDSTQ